MSFSKSVYVSIKSSVSSVWRKEFDLIHLCQRLHWKSGSIELCCVSICLYGKLLSVCQCVEGMKELTERLREEGRRGEDG